MRKVVILVLAVMALCQFTPVISSATVVIPATIHSGEPDAATVKSATNEFKTLSKKEKKERFKDVKALIKHYKAEKKEGGKSDTNTLLLCILAILLPPLAVYLYEGEINNRFWISLLLSLLLWVPGIIYALIIVLGGGDK